MTARIRTHADRAGGAILVRYLPRARCPASCGRSRRVAGPAVRLRHPGRRRQQAAGQARAQGDGGGPDRARQRPRSGQAGLPADRPVQGRPGDAGGGAGPGRGPDRRGLAWSAARWTRTACAWWRGVYAEYQRRLREANAADFGDLLLWPTVAMQRDSLPYRQRWAGRFDCVLADEYQDVCARPVLLAAAALGRARRDLRRGR